MKKMKKLKLPKLNMRNAKSFFKKNGSVIMIVLAGAASITGVVTAIHATPKAVELIEQRKDELDTEKLTAVETVKTVWELYLPTAAAEVACLAFLGCAISSNHKHTAALSTAYAISENAFLEYRNKVVETIGEKKEKEIRDQIAQDKVNNSTPVVTEIVRTGGDQLFYESLSDRYFYSTVDKVKKAQNELNDSMIRSSVGGSATINDFFDLIGLKGWSDVGDEIGWDYYKYGMIDIDFNVVLENDIPCIRIDFSRNIPRYL